MAIKTALIQLGAVDNNMFASTSVRTVSSSKPSCDGLISREVAALQARQQEINRRLVDIHSRSTRMDKMQQQIKHNKQLISNMEVQLSQIGLDLQQQSSQVMRVEQARMEMVIELQDSEEKIERIGRQLLGSFQSHPSDMERIRMALIDIQTSDQLKKVERLFKIRPHIIAFLKERRMNHQERVYRYGVELQISLLGLSEEFKGFIMGLFDQQKISHLKQRLMTPLVNYCRMLKAAETLLLQIPTDCYEGSDREIDDSIMREEIMNGLFAQRSHKRKLEQEVHRLGDEMNSIRAKMAKLEGITMSKRKEKEEAEQMIDYLQKKIAKTIKLSAESKRLALELGEVTQAIHYLTAKRTQNENFNSFNILPSPSHENQEIHQIISVWSPQKPQTGDSLFKTKQTDTKNSSKLSLLKSPTRDMNRSTKLKTRMTSPQPSWK